MKISNRCIVASIGLIVTGLLTYSMKNMKCLSILIFLCFILLLINDYN